MKAKYSVELASGVFLVLGVAALIWLATQATDYEQDIGENGYLVSARFGNIGDLRDRAPVKIGGVLVGKVDSVALDTDTFEAIVTMRIDSRFDDIPVDTSASILTSGVLGDRYIGLEPGGDPTSLQDGDELFLTQSAVVLEQLIGKFLLDAGGDDE